MDIHKPKPIHSLREFLKEVGTIVLGVCIALAAEQGVEWWHWRTQVAEAQEIIVTEMAQNLRGATLRLRSRDCVERRLDELAVILDGASKSGVLPPVGDIGVPPRIVWSFGAWDSVVASQTATHFSRQHLAALTITYRQIAVLVDRGTQEVATWNSLYAMVGPGRRLDPASEDRLRDALGQARGLNRLMSGASEGTIVRTKTLGLPFSPENLSAISYTETVSLSDPALTARIGAICTPIGPVPPNYGQAMFGSNRGNEPSHRFTDDKQQFAP